MICADLRIGKQAPVLDLKRRPDTGRILNGIANELSLTSELEIDIVLVVLALDVGHVDGDEDVGLNFFEAQEGKCDGCEVGGGRLVAGLADVRCLRRDEGIRRCSSSAGIISQYHDAKNGINNLLESAELSLGGIPDLDSVDVRTDHILQMRRHSAAIDLRASSRLANTLGNVEDYTGEAFLVDPDLLIVGDLSQLATREHRLVSMGGATNGFARKGDGGQGRT